MSDTYVIAGQGAVVGGPTQIISDDTVPTAGEVITAVGDGTAEWEPGGGGGGGITALTQDVSASGTGSVAATVNGIQDTPISNTASGNYGTFLGSLGTTLEWLNIPIQDFNGDVNTITSTLVEVVGIQSNTITESPTPGTFLGCLTSGTLDWTTIPYPTYDGDISTTSSVVEVIGIQGNPIVGEPITDCPNQQFLAQDQSAGNLSWMQANNVFLGQYASGGSGDVEGVLTSCTVIGIQGNPVQYGTPSTNDVLTWNGSQWAGASGGGGSYLVM